MKLSEIKPTLNDLFDVHGELNWSKTAWLSESLKAKAKDIKWTFEGNNLNGTFKVEDSTYVIELQPDNYIINGNRYTYINATFHKVGPDLKRHYELQVDTKNPGLVLGCIFNGIFDKTKEFEWDALIFAATDNVPKRMKFYNKIADMFKKFYGMISYNQKTKNGLCTIMFGYHIKKDDVEELERHIINNQEKV